MAAVAAAGGVAAVAVAGAEATGAGATATGTGVVDGDRRSFGLIASDGALDKEEPRSRGDHDRGSERNGEKNVAGCLLQGLRLDRLLVVPETTSHSDCS